MADEDKETPEEKVVPAPTFDAAEMGRQIGEQIKTTVAEALQNRPAAPVVDDRPHDAMEDIVGPYVERGVAKATLIGQLAADAAMFYAPSTDREDDEEKQENRAEIEKRVTQLANAGRPMTRHDVWLHLQGETRKALEKKRATKRQEREKLQQDHVDLGGNVGNPRGNPGRGGALDRDKAYDLSGQGKLSDALGDTEF